MVSFFRPAFGAFVKWIITQQHVSVTPVRDLLASGSNFFEPLEHCAPAPTMLDHNHWYSSIKLSWPMVNDAAASMITCLARLHAQLLLLGPIAFQHRVFCLKLGTEFSKTQLSAVYSSLRRLLETV